MSLRWHMFTTTKLIEIYNNNHVPYMKEQLSKAEQEPKGEKTEC